MECHSWKLTPIWKNNMTQNQENVPFEQWVDKLNNYEYHGDGFVLKNITAKLLDKNRIQHSSNNFGISIFHHRYANTDHIHKLIKKSNKHFKRYFQHITEEIMSSVFAYHHAKYRIFSHIKRYIERDDLKKPNHTWDNYKKMLDKYYFIGEQIYNTLAKDNTLMSVRLFDQLIMLKERKGREGILEGVIAKPPKAKYLIDKLLNYTFNYKGKPYKLTGGAAYWPDPKILSFHSAWKIYYIKKRIIYAVGKKLDNELNKEMKKAEKHFHRTLQHLLPEKTTIFYDENFEYDTNLSMGETTDDERLLTSILHGEIPEKDLEEIEWETLKKLIDKWLYITFTIFEVALKQREQLNLPKIELEPIESNW